MSQRSRLSDDLEERLALVVRGIQRMADAFGSLEQRLERLEAEQARAGDLLRAIGATVDAAARRAESIVPASTDHDAMQGVREEVAAAITELRAETTVIASLRDELAIDRLESSLRDVAEDTSGLRTDVRRSFDRVLHEISISEESLKGEVRAIDSRLSGFGEDLRMVRGLRDGLEALAAGVDSVRQLASRSATSNQMGELARDLSTVLAEIETARAHVLTVDQQVGRVQADAIDVAPTAAVARSVEDLERTVTEEMSDLGARIEALAERSVGAAPAEDPIVLRLRSLATSARQLGIGISEDLKARRTTKPKAKSKKR